MSIKARRRNKKIIAFIKKGYFEISQKIEKLRFENNITKVEKINILKELLDEVTEWILYTIKGGLESNTSIYDTYFLVLNDIVNFDKIMYDIVWLVKDDSYNSEFSKLTGFEELKKTAEFQDDIGALYEALQNFDFIYKYPNEDVIYRITNDIIVTKVNIWEKYKNDDKLKEKILPIQARVTMLVNSVR